MTIIKTKVIPYAPVCAKHGSNKYVRGCEGCRAYKRYRTALGRARRRESGNIHHGTRTGYDDGCRDECCKAARKRAGW